MQGIRDVYFFINTLLQEFEAHPRDDGKTSKMETILSKDGPVPCFASIQITKCAVFRVRRVPAFIAAILKCVVEIDAVGKGRDVHEQT